MNFAVVLPMVQCRTCRMQLETPSQTVPVDALLDCHGKSIADMIFELTDIMVTFDGHLPQSICQQCVQELRAAYNFRQKCIDSNADFLIELATVSMAGSSNDPNMLLMKLEKNEPELMDAQEDDVGNLIENEIDVPIEDTSGQADKPQQRNRVGTRRSYGAIARNYIKIVDNRYYCAIDEQGDCIYSQQRYDISNFVRHFRLMHRKRAVSKGLVKGMAPKEEECEPERLDTEKDSKQVGDTRKRARRNTGPRPKKKETRSYCAIAQDYIKKLDKMFHCTIDESNECHYAQKYKDVPNFVRHFRLKHPEAAAVKGLAKTVAVPGSDRIKRGTLLVPKVEKCDPESKNTAMNLTRSTRKRIIARSMVVRSSDKDQALPKRRYFCKMMREYIMAEDGKYRCAIDDVEGCQYAQRKYDMGNFLRHFRSMHPAEAAAKDLTRKKSAVIPEKKRYVRKRVIIMEPRQLMEACIKLMAMHNLPMQCFEWHGFRILLEPLAAALDLEINCASNIEYIHQAADRLVFRMRKEMTQRLVSVKVESAMYGERHFLTVSAQYEYNRTVITRVLGVIRVTEGQTARQLKTRITDLLFRYGLLRDQIFAIVLDYGTRMIATPETVQKIFAHTVSDYVERELESGEADKEGTLLKLLFAELGEQFNVMWSAVSTLQLALYDVVPGDSDPHIDRIKRFVRDLRNLKYKHFFEMEKASHPPQWCPHRWSCQFKSIRSIVKQEQFFVALSQRFPELAMDEHDWQFLRHYHDAFVSLHKLTKEMQQETHHNVFSAFYMQWLMVIKEVRSIAADNPFSKPLAESLSRRLVLLREHVVFKAALYLDPRFNYLNSVVLTPEQLYGAQV